MMTRPSVSLPPVPDEFLNQSRDYLISKFGKERFESSMHFDLVYPSEIESWPGWALMGPVERGGKYIIQYEWNTRGNAAYAPLDDAYYFASLVYTTSGELYSTYGVMDCVKHPEYCPPYKINTREKAIENFNRVCGRRYNPDVQVDFTFYSNYNRPYTDPELNDSRYVWMFMESDGNEAFWTVYIDPQTGEPVHDDFFADRNYYLLENGTRIQFNTSAKESGMQERILTAPALIARSPSSLSVQALEEKDSFQNERISPKKEPLKK